MPTDLTSVFQVVGDRYTFMPYWLVSACVDRGWVFVTPDYRLIPETTGHDCVQDAVDAYQWVLDSLSNHLSINAGPVILAGSSAGGYLALAAACSASRKPAAVLSIYGMLNPIDERYLKKGTNIFNQPLEDTAPALSQLDTARKGHLQVLSGYPATGPGPNSRSSLIAALHIEAIYPDFLTGIEGLAENVRLKGVDAIPPSARNLFPITFGLAPQYPPVILFHGKNDSAVPYTLSKEALAKLKQQEVEVYAEFPDDAEHGFDARAGRVDIERDEDSNYTKEAFESLRNILKRGGR